MTEGDTPVGLTREHRFRRSFLDDVLSYVGDHYKIPPRSLVPKPLQGPCPPLFEHSQGFMVGDPDHRVEPVQRYAGMGVDALVLRVDGLPHHHANHTKETAR
ncbi:hypothetical protein [Streptomyces sp. NRRL F-5135]|uniref:hypothetical protein n=1 Tax=Streptomyces sp. NRRL F-5135 TaxID=1463858 RepID=UPI00131E53FE|nr:hypothetical protein [Streptomyces sp. NRRL F-5135]